MGFDFKPTFTVVLRLQAFAQKSIRILQIKSLKSKAKVFVVIVLMRIETTFYTAFWFLNICSLLPRLAALLSRDKQLVSNLGTLNIVPLGNLILPVGNFIVQVDHFIVPVGNFIVWFGHFIVPVGNFIVLASFQALIKIRKK